MMSSQVSSVAGIRNKRNWLQVSNTTGIKQDKKQKQGKGQREQKRTNRTTGGPETNTLHVTAEDGFDHTLLPITLTLLPTELHPHEVGNKLSEVLIEMQRLDSTVALFPWDPNKNTPLVSPEDIPRDWPGIRTFLEDFQLPEPTQVPNGVTVLTEVPVRHTISNDTLINALHVFHDSIRDRVIEFSPDCTPPMIISSVRSHRYPYDHSYVDDMIIDEVIIED